MEYLFLFVSLGLITAIILLIRKHQQLKINRLISKQHLIEAEHKHKDAKQKFEEAIRESNKRIQDLQDYCDQLIEVKDNSTLETEKLQQRIQQITEEYQTQITTLESNSNQHTYFALLVDCYLIRVL